MNENTFNSPEEEIEYLRNQIEKKKLESKGFENRFSDKEHAHAVVREYAMEPIGKVVAPNQIMSAAETHRLMENLKPKNTDGQILVLAQVMADKGIRQAMSSAKDFNDPYLEDDFHRFLVQYLLSEHDPKNNVSKDEWKAINMVLFEINIPEAHADVVGKTKEMIALMEQWYASMQSLASDPLNKQKNYYTLEVALSEGSQDVVFYCAVHKEQSQLFEKVINGSFPEAKVFECKEDYNIFAPHNSFAGAYATASTLNALPIKTYKEMEGDSMSVIISAFTKLKKDGEGLALQILVKPAGEEFAKKYGKMLDDLRKGETLKRVIDKQSILKETFHTFGTMFSSADEVKKDEEKKKGQVDEIAMKFIQKKLESTIVETNIRVIASAETTSRAQMIIKDVEASFHQFSMPQGNTILFKDLNGKKLGNLLHNFTYRMWDTDQSLPLSQEELASVFHFPLAMKDFGNVKSAKASSAQAPTDLPQTGIILGVNEFRGVSTPIHFAKEDRMRHLYAIGQTGTGKTTVFKNMIIQDMQNGDGCCFIDPHGSDILDILANVPKERLDDVIYFDPAYVERPMGLNMLEYDRAHPEQKTFIVNELFGIFNQLFDMKSSGGPGFEQYFRNATMLVMEHPESGNTLLEISRVFSDKDFRDYKLSKCKNPLLLQFWQNAEKTTGEQGLQNWVNYVTGKFDVFMTNDIMRPIITQEKSSFNFRDIMDKKKILLVNLSKGRLGDMNAKLIGLILVGKISQAALSRVDTNERPDFYLYIDEFQNVTTPSIASILSEARKYRLSLNITHQYIGQLTEEIKNAVFGNVGSILSYRIGADDAKYLESQFAPTFTASDLMKIESFQGYLKMLANNEPKKPFVIKCGREPKGDREMIDTVKEMSYLKYGRDRAEVEAEVLRKYSL